MCSGNTTPFRLAPGGGGRAWAAAGEDKRATYVRRKAGGGGGRGRGECSRLEKDEQDMREGGTGREGKRAE